MAAFQTLDDLAPGQRLLVRVDLNAPIEDGAPQDTRRFARYAETIQELLDAEHAVAILAHQGRPGRDDFVSLVGHADILASHLDRDVSFVADTFGEEALDAIQDLDGGEALLLENTRMCDGELPEEPPETKAETEFVRSLAPAFDAYVNDAYSAAHRSHASLVGFPLVMDAYAGRVMAAEYDFNTSVATREFDGDVTMVLGGNKPGDVIQVMRALGDRVDDFLLGGVGGELFLRADGYPVGRDVGDTDLYDEPWAETGDDIRALLASRRDDIHLPVDLAYEDADGQRAEVAVPDIEEKTDDYLDVGSRTAEAFADVIHDSAAVFTKGALGVFEDERFSHGTVEVLQAIGETDCFSVVGGGDTSRAIDLYGLHPDDYDHLSIAGGAYLRALTGEALVAIEVLERARH